MKINNYNQESYCGTGNIASLLPEAIIQTYLWAAYFLSVCFEYGFFIATKL